MLDWLTFTSYKLSFISLISVVIFWIIIFILQKRKHFPFYFIFLASCLPLVSLFRKGVYQSGDFAINIEKTIDLYNSLHFGIFPVHWASILNAQYGYPLFIFTYPLPYYSIALFKFLGFSFVSSEKIAMGLVFILSGLGMYLLSKQFFAKSPALLSTTLYLFAPYHLIDLHFRTALGETFAYAVLPFIFYFMLKALKKNSFKILFFLCLSFCLLILSHQAIAIVSTPFIFALPLFLKGSRRDKKYMYLALIGGLLLSAFYWLPVILMLPYTHQVDYAKTILFENPLLYFVSPWKFGFLYQGPIGQLSFPIGFIQLFLLIISLILVIKGKFKGGSKKLLISLLFVFSFLLFMLLPISKPIWKIIPLLTNFQFAYRLMLPISFVLALIGGITAAHIKRSSFIYILTLLAIMSTLLNWGNRAMIADINDNYLIQHAPYSTYEGEGLQPASPKWRNIHNIWEQKPTSPISQLSGTGKVVQLERLPTEHKYIIDAKGTSEFVENTFYFPGWTLYVDNSKYPFNYIDDNHSDIIHFHLEKGRHLVDLKFEETGFIRLANVVSFLTLFILLVLLLQRIFHKRI